MSNIESVNRRFYESLWRNVRLIDPSRFNTWPRVQELSDGVDARLEVGPGMRPRLPITDTHFVDLSSAALGQLGAAGGLTAEARVQALPYADASFDLLAALDIIEHVEDDDAALAELARVARPGAHALFAMPLFMDCWTPFDDIVGHRLRYEPADLDALLKRHGFEVMESCAYGMQPKSNRLVDWGMRHLEEHPDRALWYYNHILMPLGLWFQKKLRFETGWCDLSGVDEVLLLCRYAGTSD